MARRYRRRRKARRRYEVSTSVNSTRVSVFGTLDSAAQQATSVVVDEVAGVENLDETQNRKIIQVVGDLDVNFHLAAGQWVEAMTMLIAWPKERDFPNISEFDPFSQTDVAGNPAYEGGVAAPWGIRRFAFTLPTGAQSAVLGAPQRYLTKSQRLLKPGHSLRVVHYVRGSAAINGRFAFIGSVKILN